MALSLSADVGGRRTMSIINASLIKDNPRHKTGLFFKKITHSALIITLPARVCARTYYCVCN